MNELERTAGWGLMVWALCALVLMVQDAPEGEDVSSSREFRELVCIESRDEIVAADCGSLLCPPPTPDDDTALALVTMLPGELEPDPRRSWRSQQAPRHLHVSRVPLYLLHASLLF